MLPTTSLLGLVALWLLPAVAGLSGPVTGGQSLHSIPLVHNTSYVRNGAMEMFRTFSKYNVPIPGHLQQKIVQLRKDEQVAPKGQEGSVPAVSKDGDLMWLAEVGIGSPPQKLNLDLDTGSSDTWVFSTETRLDDVEGQSTWNPNKSSTSREVKNCTWSILYGDFSTSQGNCWKDTLTLGNLSIPDMTIESATTVSDMFTETRSMSGLVGLGWPDLAQTVPVQKTLLDYLPKFLKQGVFTVDMKHNSTGTFDFGFVNHSIHDSEIQYLNVNTTDGFWQILHKGFWVEGTRLKHKLARARDVIVDTGTTLLFLPDSAVKTYFDFVPGANFSYREYAYLIPCHQKPPDLTLELGDKEGNTVVSRIPGEYLIYANVSDGMCFAGLQSLGAFSSLEGILGDIFLKSGFSVFDIATKRYGVATKKISTTDDGRIDARLGDVAVSVI